MRNLLVLALAAAGLGALFALPACDDASEGQRPAATGNKYVDDIHHLTTLLREKWSWLELREEEGLDLEALERDAVALCRREPSDRGFLRGLTSYMSGIRDGHASVALAGVHLRESRRWPFSLIEVEEGVMVDGIDPATFRSKALKRGDLVLAIDDRPIDEVILEQEHFVFASTPAARRRKAIFALTESTQSASYHVRILPMGGTEPRTAEVACPLRNEPVPRYSWRAFEETYQDLDAGTAYLCVGTFSSKDPAFAGAPPDDRDRILAAQYDAYARLFEKIAKKTDLVLDLRGNPGGTDLLGQALAGHLLRPGFCYYHLSSRRDGRWSVPHPSKPEVGHGTPRFNGRVVCLIDEQTFSAADNLAACLRDEHPNVRFFGRPTGGGSGAPRTFLLPATKAEVRFCTMRVYAPGGRVIEGEGVEPDVPIRPRLAQLLAGEDAVLEAARASLER